MDSPTILCYKMMILLLNKYHLLFIIDLLRPGALTCGYCGSAWHSRCTINICEWIEWTAKLRGKLCDPHKEMGSERPGGLLKVTRSSCPKACPLNSLSHLVLILHSTLSPSHAPLLLTCRNSPSQVVIPRPQKKEIKNWKAKERIKVNLIYSWGNRPRSFQGASDS